MAKTIFSIFVIAVFTLFAIIINCFTWLLEKNTEWRRRNDNK